MTISLLFLFASLAAYDAKSFFVELQKKETSRVPEYYQSEISSLLVREQLKTIPDDQIVFGKKPEAWFMYYKEEGFRLWLENVEPFYRDLLNIYSDVLEQSGLYFTLLRSGDYARFRQYYNMTVKKSDEAYELTLTEVEGMPGDKAVLFYDSEYKLLSSDYYENGEKVLVVGYRFANVGGKQVLSSINMESQDRKLLNDLDIEFSNTSLKKPSAERIKQLWP